MHRYLEQQGHDVEIIDYRPSYLRTQCNLLAIGPRYTDKGLIVKIMYLIAKAPGRLVWPFVSCKKAFDEFTRTCLKRTGRRYHSIGALRKHPPEAAVYVVGSDQVWNSFYANGRDPAYYLDFGDSEVRRVSYAASFSVDKINPDYADYVKSRLDWFHSISVREKHGLAILDGLGVSGASHVLDPVFLLSPEEWEAFVAEEPVECDDRYILMYDLEQTDEIRRFATTFAKEKGLKIYAVNNYKRTVYADRDFYKSGPRTFIKLIKNAEMVIGNSFHAMAFSLIFKKEFLVFPRLHEGADINTRMISLLDETGLQDRLLKSFDSGSAAFPEINYDFVHATLKQRIAYSKQYLDEALAP